MSSEEKGSNLEEVTTQERIDLVSGDSVRRWGQIILAFTFIGAMLSFLVYYVISGKASDEWLQSLADTMTTLLIMGVGAALAIFGLGRTVGKRS